MSTPYRKRKAARPFDDAGQLHCDRCGGVVVGWPLQRPDNCGLGVSCIRQPAAVLASWRRFGFAVPTASPEGADHHGRDAVLDPGGERVTDLGDASTAAAIEVTTPAAPVAGIVYLLHFTTPYKHAQHYLGATGKSLDQRISAHRGGEFAGDHDGRPAKLIAALLGAGGDFVVARTWSTATRKAAFLLERSLKKRGSRGRLCPICTPGTRQT